MLIFRSFFLLKKRVYLFLERGEGTEKERERNVNVWLPLVHPLLETWPATPAHALTGHLGLQARIQSTELHQPGKMLIFQWNKRSLNHLTWLIIYTGYQREKNISKPLFTHVHFRKLP